MSDSQTCVTPDLFAQWKTQGYLVFPRMFAGDRLELIRAHFDDVLNGIYDLERRPIVPFASTDRGKATRIIDNPHWADSIMAAVASDKRIGKIAASLMDTRAVRLWAVQLLSKPPSHSNESVVGWHQDYDYWECASPPELVTAWLPLDDVGTTNGTLSVFEGSHLRGHKRLRAFMNTNLDPIAAADDIFEELPERELSLSAGQVSFHHCLTLHGSRPNNSEKPRRAISIHMMPDGTCYKSGTQCDKHPNVFLLGREDGSAFEGRHFPIIYSTDTDE